MQVILQLIKYDLLRLKGDVNSINPMPLVPASKIILPHFHIKLGLMRNSVGTHEYNAMLETLLRPSCLD